MRKTMSAKVPPLSVTGWIRQLKHPLKREVSALRRVILAVRPDVREEVKWESPSFFTTEHFATINLSAKDRLRLVLHSGAKVKAPKRGVTIADPAGLLEWRGSDRAIVTFLGREDFEAKRAALVPVLRAWLETFLPR